MSDGELSSYTVRSSLGWSTYMCCHLVRSGSFIVMKGSITYKYMEAATFLVLAQYSLVLVPSKF